ncbi:helix-turn-helix domain-containing protein [Herbiconiux liukaitaii]|uniref:helix-turn-helix domain-containing protein n=1 Tax=Herbiconiux liukaitaii TaxID=3342799 RepID=UPI0035BB1B9A
MLSRTTELTHFLRSRRAQLSPTAVGLPQTGNRRVPGLKRDELAGLAGISLEYYVRIEQGRGHQMSDQVISSLARALRLGVDERSYFVRLARPVPADPVDRGAPQPIGETVLTLLERWREVPAYVFDSNQDIVAINEMADLMCPGLQLYGGNLVIANFEVAKIAPDNEQIIEGARRAVAALRYYGDPDNPRLREIVGTLSTENPLFRQLWAEHSATTFANGTVPVSISGELVEVPWQVLDVPGGFFIVVMPVVEGTRVHELFTRLRDTEFTGRPLRGPLVGWPAL